MAAAMAPHWGAVIFLVAIYTLSALLHLDPNVVNPGGAAIITPSTVAAIDVVVFIGVVIAALSAGWVAAAASSSAITPGAGSVLGGAAFLGVLVAGVFFTGTMGFLTFLGAVVTFANLGIPEWIQFALAIPCALMFIWTLLAFLSAILGLRGDAIGGA
jgi:hypothetical protein